MFRRADLVLLTKVDLAPHIDFDEDAALRAARVQYGARVVVEWSAPAPKRGDLGVWDWNIATGELAHNDRMTAMLGYACAAFGRIGTGPGPDAIAGGAA